MKQSVLSLKVVFCSPSSASKLLRAEAKGWKLWLAVSVTVSFFSVTFLTWTVGKQPRPGLSVCAGAAFRKAAWVYWKGALCCRVCNINNQQQLNLSFCGTHSAGRKVKHVAWQALIMDWHLVNTGSCILNLRILSLFDFCVGICSAWGRLPVYCGEAAEADIKLCSPQVMRECLSPRWKMLVLLFFRIPELWRWQVLQESRSGRLWKWCQGHRHSSRHLALLSPVP